MADSRDRLTLNLMLSKALHKANQTEKALLNLQLLYTESPHFNSLLFLYGKYAVQNKAIHSSHLVPGMSAL